MKLYSTTFCVLMIFGAGLICDDRDKGVRTIDRSCDLKKVHLPAPWRAQCVKDHKLRTDVDYETRQACKRLLDNEQILAARGCH